MIIPTPPAARRRRYSMYGVAGRSGFLNISLAPCAVMTTRFLTSTGPSLMGDRIIDAEVTAPLPRFTKRCLINGAYALPATRRKRSCRAGGAGLDLDPDGGVREADHLDERVGRHGAGF